MMSLSHMLVFCTVVSNTSRPVVLIPDSFCTSFQHCLAALPWSSGLFSTHEEQDVCRHRSSPQTRTLSHGDALRELSRRSDSLSPVHTDCTASRELARAYEEDAI